MQLSRGPFQQAGDYGSALKYLEQSLTIRQEIGDKSGEAYTLFNLGSTYLDDRINRVEEGHACILKAAQINEFLKDARLAQALKKRQKAERKDKR
ncbi:MAG: tetratricopeptide repeat protein, partial [bacterium]|nr:tetratricopeptide repeat protein [bacterium]